MIQNTATIFWQDFSIAYMNYEEYIDNKIIFDKGYTSLMLVSVPVTSLICDVTFQFVSLFTQHLSL